MLTIRAYRAGANRANWTGQENAKKSSDMTHFLTNFDTDMKGAYVVKPMGVKGTTKDV